MVGLSVRPNEGANPALNPRDDHRIPRVKSDPFMGVGLNNHTFAPVSIGYARLYITLRVQLRTDRVIAERASEIYKHPSAGDEITRSKEPGHPHRRES